MQAWPSAKKPFTVVPGKLTLGRAFAHPAVKEFGLAVLVWNAGAKAQNVGARELKAQFPLPERFGEPRPMHLV